MEQSLSDKMEEAFGCVVDWLEKNSKMLVQNDGGEWEEIEVIDIDDIEAAQEQQLHQPHANTQ